MNNNQHSISKIYNKFLTKTYGWMSFGLLLTAFISVLVAATPDLFNIIFTNRLVFFGIIIAQLGLVSYLSIAIERMSASTATTSFVLYSMLTGLTVSSIFFVYSLSSIVTIFLICSGMFACMALYGHFTKADLSSMGSTLMMILFGMIISSLANLFFRNEMFDYLISCIGVVIFSLFTAYDSQKIKGMAESFYESDEDFTKYSIMGALALYLDFINLFMYLLRFLGRRRD